MLLAAATALILGTGPIQAEELLLQGSIVDTTGSPVTGAELFVYDSAKTKRQADFISPRTGTDGKFSLKLPTGQYWVVARVRQGDKYGPLLPGDLHSGEPQEIDLTAGSRDLTLTVADIRDLTRSKEKTSATMSRLTGRITDKGGKPLEGYYVCAWRTPRTERFPDLVSGWTDRTGEYLLFLPPGEYQLAAAATFPPAMTASTLSAVTLPADEKKVAFDIQITTMEQETSSAPTEHNDADGVPLQDE
jgi:hypothetical protein